MKYFAFNIQTGGYNYDKHSLLDIGVIFEDTKNPLPYDKIPKFYRIINNPILNITPEAALFNRDILDVLVKNTRDQSYDSLVVDSRRMIQELTEFINTHDSTLYFDVHKIKKQNTETALIYNPILNKHDDIHPRANLINASGKNFTNFIYPFLTHQKGFSKFIQIHYRIIEPTSSYIELEKDDVFPSLEECLKRVKDQSKLTEFKPQDKIPRSLIKAFQFIELFRCKDM